MKPIVSIKIFTLLCIVCICFFNRVNSQTQIFDTSFKLEDVIVTAQKRSELLHNVPLAISSLNAKQIESIQPI